MHKNLCLIVCVGFMGVGGDAAACVMTPGRIQQSLIAKDVDKDGSLSFAEFLQGSGATPEQLANKNYVLTMRDLFDAQDLDRNGTFSLQEYAAYVAAIGIRC